MGAAVLHVRWSELASLHTKHRRANPQQFTVIRAHRNSSLSCGMHQSQWLAPISCPVHFRVQTVTDSTDQLLVAQAGHGQCQHPQLYYSCKQCCSTTDSPAACSPGRPRPAPAPSAVTGCDSRARRTGCPPPTGLRPCRCPPGRALHPHLGHPRWSLRKQACEHASEGRQTSTEKV